MEQFTLKNGVFRNDKGKKLGTLPEVITHYQVARPHYEWSADCPQDSQGCFTDRAQAMPWPNWVLILTDIILPVQV